MSCRREPRSVSRVRSRRGCLRLDPANEYGGKGVQYLVASSQCYGPYFSDPIGYRLELADYQRIFAETEEVARFTPSSEHPGPELRILKVKQP